MSDRECGELARSVRILIRHVLPNAGGTIVVAATAIIGQIVLIDATAGLGWWTWFFPGLVLVIVLVCLNLVGDALDAALNPGAGTA